MTKTTHASSVWRRFAPHALLAALAAFAAPRLGAQTTASTVVASGLSNPSGLAVDSLGNVYVGEYSGTIKKIAPNGAVTTVANTGSYYPYGMTRDAANNIYISNYGGNTVQKLTPAGDLSTYATTSPAPIGLGFGPTGDLFVANRNSPPAVQKITPQGAISTFVTLPTHPVGMAVDATGNLYVGYTSNFISKVTPAGAISTFLNTSSSYGIAIAPTGEIVYSETSGTVRKATAAGVVTTLATGLNFPWGVAVDLNGNVYVACYNEGTVRRLTTVGIGVNFSAGLPVDATAQPGVIGGHNWNNVPGGSGANIVLNDTTGGATTARLAFAATGSYGGFSAPSTANAATNTLYQGGLYGATTEVSVTVTNIPYAYYDVYTFASADTGNTSTLSISNGATTYYYRSNGQSNAGAASLQQATSTDAANPTVGRALFQVFRTVSGSTLTLTTGGSIHGALSNNLFGIHLVPVAAPPVPAPVITSATTATGTYNASFTYQIAASNSPTSFNATGLPAGLSVNPSTGVISGTPTQSGTFTVNLTATNVTGPGSSALTLTINKAAASVTLGALAHTYDGAAKSATATTSPAGLSVDLSYTGAALPPVNAGDYGVLATISHANYTGSATGTLTIAKAPAGLSLANLTQPYDGTPRPVTAITSPAGLPVIVAYNGSTTVPTAVGSYAVAATINHQNYTGSVSGTLQITDTIAPVLTLPANLTVEATGASGAVATFTATASDNVDGPVAVTLAPASGTTFPLGTTSVNATATDAAGNTATGSFTVTVKDTTAPTITRLAASSTSLSPANHKLVAITLTATATDTVSAVTTKILAATSNEPDDGLGDGDTAGDIQITGPMTLNLRAERSGTGNGRIYTIVVEARDAAGNTSTKTITVSVPKSQNGQ